MSASSRLQLNIDHTYAVLMAELYKLWLLQCNILPDPSQEVDRYATCAE